MADVMHGYVERGEMAGVVTLPCRRDEVHVEAIGARDLAAAAPMRRDTIFRIASMTKPITAAAAMILVEEVKLRLDEPVNRWLPGLADRKVLRGIDSPLDDTVPAKRPITLRDLLSFPLGLGAVMDRPNRYPIQKAMAEAGLAPAPKPLSFSPDAFMERVGNLPLMHQPGEQWILSRPAVELMTPDQLTPEQKASPFLPGFWDTRGWGFGVSVITRRGGVGLSPGSSGWDGGFSTSGYCDPHEDMVGILLVQRMMSSPSGFDFHRDFWTLGFQAIDD